MRITNPLSTFRLWHAVLILTGWVHGCTALASVHPSSSAASAASASSQPTPVAPPRDRNAPIPITVLSGFLGSGKTTLLQNLLSNHQGLRIAVVVNDAAAVNIDSKLVLRSSAAGVVELQNGCACCAKSEELLASVADLVTLSDLKGDDESFHHIVVEMSGVADPKSVRANFQEAKMYDMPLLERVRLDTMVTLVDCSTFLDYLQSTSTASPEEMPELFYGEGEEPDDDLDSIPENLAMVLGLQPQKENNGVADLIVSQSEISDIVLMNKIDLAEPKERVHIRNIVQALNPRAHIIETEYGDVSLGSVLGTAQGLGVVQAGVVDDHRDAIHAATCKDPDCDDVSHSHKSHHHRGDDYESHDHHAKDQVCADPSHTHSHSHDHSPDTAHSHSHQSHSEEHSGTDSSHSHSHDHQSCEDSDCTDPTHDHSTSTEHAGIGTFVYRARRPFHPARLLAFLEHMPIKRGLPTNDPSLSKGDSIISISDQTKQVLRRIVRSKGFSWTADSHISALYWSHAGSSFELSCLGSWWATLPREQWPPEAMATILADFDDTDHDEGSTECYSVGDRRQEVVFIGPTMSEKSNQDMISNTLEQCILNDKEWDTYVANRTAEDSLFRHFPPTVEIKMATF